MGERQTREHSRASRIRVSRQRSERADAIDPRLSPLAFEVSTKTWPSAGSSELAQSGCKSCCAWFRGTGSFLPRKNLTEPLQTQRKNQDAQKGGSSNCARRTTRT